MNSGGHYYHNGEWIDEDDLTAGDDGDYNYPSFKEWLEMEQ